jgi:hypothetical protein
MMNDEKEGEKLGERRWEKMRHMGNILFIFMEPKAEECMLMHII